MELVRSGIKRAKAPSSRMFERDQLVRAIEGAALTFIFRSLLPLHFLLSSSLGPGLSGRLVGVVCETKFFYVCFSYSLLAPPA